MKITNELISTDAWKMDNNKSKSYGSGVVNFFDQKKKDGRSFQI